MCKLVDKVLAFRPTIMMDKIESSNKTSLIIGYLLVDRWWLLIRLSIWLINLENSVIYSKCIWRKPMTPLFVIFLIICWGILAFMLGGVPGYGLILYVLGSCPLWFIVIPRNK